MGSKDLVCRISISLQLPVELRNSLSDITDSIRAIGRTTRLLSFPASVIITLAKQESDRNMHPVMPGFFRMRCTQDQ